MRNIFLSALFGLLAFGQTSRNVTVSANAVAGAVGYNIYRADTPAGPFLVPLNSTPATTPFYIDQTAVIGNTYTYGMAAVAVPCTPTTPVGSVCGTGKVATATTTVPLQPAAVSVVSINIL